jgi:hypothetical protein
VRVIVFLSRSPRAVLWAVLLLGAGCSSGPPPSATSGAGSTAGSSSPPPPAIVQGSELVSGEPSAVEDDEAPYRYRFRQVDPASDRFSFRDRELSFYFRPTPDVIHFQVENLQDRPVWIDWDRSSFVDWQGRSGRIAHRGVTWPERFNPPPPTQIAGLQHYADYVYSVDQLVAPASPGQLLRRRMFPVSTASPEFLDRNFGVDLVFMIEDKPYTYTFRFKVVSIVPR